jgi:hypothetical protein
LLDNDFRVFFDGSRFDHLPLVARIEVLALAGEDALQEARNELGHHLVGRSIYGLHEGEGPEVLRA